MSSIGQVIQDVLNPPKPTPVTYAPTTTVDEGGIIPIGFGMRKVGSNIIRGLEASDGGALIVLAAHCQGECKDSLATYIEDKEFGRYPAVYAHKEFKPGSLTQTNAQWDGADLFSGQIPYRGTAYTAIRVSKEKTQLSGEIDVTAYLKLLLCEPIGGGAYVWTNNPAVILWHWYRVFEGKAISELDTQAFQALEALCAAYPSNSSGGPMRPVGPGEDTVKASSTYNAKFLPQFASDPNTTADGESPLNVWLSSSAAAQRINFDLGFAVKLAGLRLVNYHHNGGYTNRGVNAFTVQGSNDPLCMDQANPSSDTCWTNVQTGLGAAEYNASTNTEEVFQVTGSPDAYRYYSLKITSNHGGSYTGIRDLQFLAVTPRYCFDYLLAKQASNNDFKKLLWKAFNGCVIRSQGVLKPVWEGCQEHDLSGGLTAKTSQHTFNVDNIQAGKFTWGIPDKPNVVRITYLDASRDYTKATIAVSDDADIADRGEVVQEEKCEWICYEDAARRRAQLILDRARYRDFSVKLSAMPDASHLEVFDLVKVTHTLAGWTDKQFIVLSKKEDAYGLCDFELGAYHEGLYDDREAPVNPTYHSTLESPFRTPGHVTNLAVAENSYRDPNGNWINKLTVTYTMPSDSLYVAGANIQVSTDGGSTWTGYGTDISMGTGFVIDGGQAGFTAGDTVHVRALPVTTLGKMADDDTADTMSETVDFPDLATEIAAGGKIILPAGTYTVTGSISFPDKNVALIGAAGGDVIIQNQDGYTPFSICQRSKVYEFKNLKLDSQNTASGSYMISCWANTRYEDLNTATLIVDRCNFDLAASGDVGVYYYGGEGVLNVTDCTGASGANLVRAVRLEGDLVVDGCYDLANMHSPISITTGSFDFAQVTNNTIKSYDQWGINIFNATINNSLVVSGNKVELAASSPANDQIGIRVDAMGCASVTNNYSKMVVSSAGAYTQTPLKVCNNDSGVISSNQCHLDTDSTAEINGAYIEYSDGCDITNNTVAVDNSDTTSNHFGMYIYQCDNCTIDNNPINGTNSNAEDIGICLNAGSFYNTGISNSITNCGTAIDDNGTGNTVGDQDYLGSAARKSAGSAAGEVLLLDGTGKIPAVDGSNLTNLGTMASQNADSVNIDGGTIDGVDYVTCGGSGIGHGYFEATSSGGARTAIMGALDSGNYIFVGAKTNHALNFVRDNVQEWYFNANGFQPSSDNTMDLGASNKRLDDIYATNGTIQTSDGSLKKDMTETVLGLDFVMALSPKQFTWADHYVEPKRDIQTGKVKEPGYTKTHKRKHHGLIAQDVEKVLADMGVDADDFAGFVRDSETGRLGLRYQEFLAPMIRAIQELAAEVAALKAAAGKNTPKA